MRRFQRVLAEHPALMFGLSILVVLLISGHLGTTFGVHNLFRDHPSECPDDINGDAAPCFSLPAIVNLLWTPATRTQAHTICVLGLAWIFAFLLSDQKSSPEGTRQMRSSRELLLPALPLLAIGPMAAAFLAVFDARPHQDSPILDALALQWIGKELVRITFGVIIGLALVVALIELVIVVARSLRISQFRAALVVSAFALIIASIGVHLLPEATIFILLAWFVLIYAVMCAVPSWQRITIFAAAVVVGVLVSAVREFGHTLPGDGVLL